MISLKSINTKYGRIFYNRVDKCIKLYFLTPEYIDIKYQTYPNGFLLHLCLAFNADIFEKLFSNSNSLFANDFLDIITYDNFKWLESSFYAKYLGQDKEKISKNKNELIFKEALSSVTKSTEFKDFFKHYQLTYLITPIPSDFPLDKKGKNL